MSVVFKILKQNFVYIKECNNQLKTSLTWKNLGILCKYSESRQGWGVGWVCREVTLCMSHPEVPKETTVLCQSHRKKNVIWQFV